MFQAHEAREARIHSILKMAFAEYRCSVHIRNPDTAAYDDLFPETFGLLYDWLQDQPLRLPAVENMENMENMEEDEDDEKEKEEHLTWDYWNALDEFDRTLMQLHPLSWAAERQVPTEEDVFQALLKAYRLSLLV